MAGEKPAARITDLHICPESDGPVPHVGGAIITGSPNVLIGGMPAARVTDTVTCVGPPATIIRGSSGVFINGLPAARMGDQTSHGGVIVGGMPTVLIGETEGEDTEATSVADTVESEIPDPNDVVPGGPWTEAPGQRPGTFYGPKQAKGGRETLRWVPPGGEGPPGSKGKGPPGSEGYWKTKMPDSKGWTRYNQEGQPISAEEAHPNPMPSTPESMPETSTMPETLHDLPAIDFFDPL